MSLLTGTQIKEEIKRGRIQIDPFDENLVNPNSYNLRLFDTLLVYQKNYPVHYSMSNELKAKGKVSLPGLALEPLDMKVHEPTIELKIGPDGMTLFPGVLYLAATIETAGSHVFVPCIEGRSSVGRLGVCIHVTAGFGDLGFSDCACPAQWTCEIAVVHPIKVYAGVEICQIVFTTPFQEDGLGPLLQYKGKYTGQRGPKASGLWKDFNKAKNNGTGKS